MGYDVHITRAKHWTESESEPILLSDWIRYVTADPDMRLDGVAVAKTPDGDVLSYKNEGLSVWTGWSRHLRDGNMAWFDFRNGEVVVKNPDDEILEKMRRIAAALGARVIGDEGEIY